MLSMTKYSFIAFFCSTSTPSGMNGSLKKCTLPMSVEGPKIIQQSFGTMENFGEFNSCKL